MKTLNRDQVLGRVRERGLAVFQNDSQPFNLNIVLTRAKIRKLDQFNDQFSMYWKHNGSWFEFTTNNFTTLPGSYYLKRKLLNPQGCAILAPGQYRGIYALRLHNNKYEALCQTHGPVKVFRDKNKDDVFDLNPDRTFMGDYGINVHNSPDGMVTKKVFSHSAGCQVFADDKEFFKARDIWRLAKQEFGNRFTLTLVDE